MFRDALVDEMIESNPCMLHRGELPEKIDKDPEWRMSATYTAREVEQLISDARIPVERRVQYALKAIAGLRHGELAGVRWRHYDLPHEPLGRLVVGPADVVSPIAAIERYATVTLSIGSSGPDREDGTRAVDLSIGKGRMTGGDRVLPMSYCGRSGRWRLAGEARPAADVKAERATKNTNKRVGHTDPNHVRAR